MDPGPDLIPNHEESEERKRDAEEAARREAEIEQGADEELDAQS